LIVRPSLVALSKVAGYTDKISIFHALFMHRF